MNRFMKGMSNGGVIQSRDGAPLTTEAMHAVVPSIFAVEAHESRSARFVPIPTINVLDGLRREGFEPFFAQQARTRIEGKQEFTKHMIRMRHRSLARADGEAFEIILVNANDGSAAYQMIPGFFRFVCANGLMTGETFNEIKVRHSGNAVDDVIQGAYTVLDEAPRVIEQAEVAKCITLSAQEQRLFAESAHVLRFPQAHIPAGDEDDAAVEPVRRAPIEPDTLLRARRFDDRGADLWSTFNRVQENTIKGGQPGHTVGANGRHRRATTRAVQGIDANRALNRALWTLMEGMASLKAAA